MSRRARAERWVPPSLQERGLAERLAGIEKQRAKAAKKATSDRFRAWEKAAEASYLAAREATKRGEGGS